MHIHKIGHCCLSIKTQNLHILTDPGAWTDAQNMVTGIDIILITHEHADHVHIDSVKTILANNPHAKIYTNSGVGKLLDEAGVVYTPLEKGDTETIQNVLIESFEFPHEEIYNGISLPQNTGYFIDNTLFYPGDAFGNPNRDVPVLALPVCGPWMHIKDALDYAKEIKPKKCFPVHDGMLRIYGPFHFLPAKFLGEAGIEFATLEAGGEMEV